MFRAALKPSPFAAATDSVFERYESRPPAPQNAVDAVPGWRTALPAELGVIAGDLALVHDPRITWAIEALGGVTDARILELGPLDGGHTAMLHAAGAARIDAIESNKLAFLRCLVTKELLGLTRARFHLGDFTTGLGTAAGRYDAVLASGVLYHLADPIALLERVASLTDRLIIWSHVADEVAMPRDDPRRAAFTGRIDSVLRAGRTLRLHERRYHGSDQDIVFCGGVRDRHVWLERDSLLNLLRDLGFESLQVGHDMPDAPGGPALAVVASRDGRAAADD